MPESYWIDLIYPLHALWRVPRHPCGRNEFLESVGDEQGAGAVTPICSETLSLFVTAAAMKGTVRGERVLRRVGVAHARLEDMVRGEKNFDQPEARKYSRGMSDQPRYCAAIAPGGA